MRYIAFDNFLSPVEVLLTVVRKTLVPCRIDKREAIMSARTMEIGSPTNVQHISHVTFDQFNGFLGLPLEFQVEIPRPVPSASASVFGVSVESMQCAYDSRGNHVPIILLLLQERLYSQDGLKAEGIFRVNPEDSSEERFRNQLNMGIVPVDIDVHSLAGLIKSWFRELPSGVLDGLSPDQILACDAEEDAIELVKQLMPTEAALLNWVVDLMIDVVQEEDWNKMNVRNVAVVFAPNLTKMSDPLTALVHAVQVMNLLRMLMERSLREREETTTAAYSPSCSSFFGSQSEDFDSQQETRVNCEPEPVAAIDDYQLSSNNDIDDTPFLRYLDDCKVNCTLNALTGPELEPQSCVSRA